MAEIKVEKKKPIWPWVIGGVIILALIGFLMMGDNDNQNRDQSATRTESGTSGTDDKAGNRVGAAADNTADRAGNAADNTADRAGNAADNTADRAGNAADNTADRVGNAADNTADRVGNAADNTANRVGNAADNTAGAAGGDQAVESFVSYVKSDIGRADLDNQKVSQAFTRLTAATDAKAAQVGHKAKNIQTAKANINKISGAAFESAPAHDIRETAELITSDLQSIQVAKFPKLDNKVEKLREASTSINPDELAMEQSEEIKDYLTEAAELLEDMK